MSSRYFETLTSRVPNVIVPFTEPATFLQRTTVDAFTSIPVAKIHRKIIDSREKGFSLNVLIQAELILQVTTTYLSVIPKQDDQVITLNDNVTWIILGVKHLMQESIFDMAVMKAY